MLILNQLVPMGVFASTPALNGELYLLFMLWWWQRWQKVDDDDDDKDDDDNDDEEDEEEDDDDNMRNVPPVPEVTACADLQNFP